MCTQVILLRFWEWVVLNKGAELSIAHVVELLDIVPFSDCSCLNEDITSAFES